MRIFLFIGSHPRHLFVHRSIVQNFEVCGAICVKREEILPQPPVTGIEEGDKKNFIRHFKDRLAAEQKYFKEEKVESVFKGLPLRYCAYDKLNTSENADFMKRLKPDAVFIFGTGLIKDPLLSVLPKDRVNFHLGISPEYRGSATLFWPFYNMQPQWAGCTIHQIVIKADAGNVIHQCVPELEKGDGIHDVACKTVIKATSDLVEVFKQREKIGFFNEVPQISTGRLYKSGDFKPEHLRVVYDLFDNKIVDAYLNGEVSQDRPKLISSL